MKIAIQGHPTRGKEVIQILESLGGKNTTGLNGCSSTFYYIDKGKICNSYYLPTNFKIYILEEFEKEFPFKIGDKVTVMTDITYKIVALEYYMGRLCYKLDNGLNYSSNILTLYKEMKEERNITLTLDKAREWYNKGGELKEIALQTFTKEELNPLPKSWEEYCKGYKVPAMIFGPCISNKYVTLWKLEQLRDCYRQGWKPDWTNSQVDKYCIVISANKPEIITLIMFSAFLSFQSEEVAKEFIKNFEPLIREAEEFI